MNILREELVKRGNNYELVIHLLNNTDEEFSKELSTEDNQEAVKSDILSYVKRKYPHIKINAVRLMVGGMLITTFTLGQGAAAFAAPKDINTSSEYARLAIERLVNQQVIVGDEQGNFNPRSSMDRDAFTTMLVKAMGFTIVTPDVPTFKDVPKDNWAYPFIETAVANNLISGVSGDSFAPKNRITREQMAVILVRSLQLSSDDIRGMGDQLTFADKGDISDYARDSVGFAVAHGLFRGDDSNRFLGKNTATREQVAVVIDNYLTNRETLVQAAEAMKTTTFTAAVTADSLTAIRLDFNKPITALAPGDVNIADADGRMISITGVALSTDGRSAMLTTQKMTSGVPYVVTINRDDLKGQSTITPTMTIRDLAVESIVAIDAKNILIQFNNKVEAGTGINGAERAANYSVSPNNNIAGTKLGDDKSSVILTLDTAMTNDTAYTVKVGKNIMDVDGKPLSATTDYSSYLFFSDHTPPTIRNLSTTELGAVKIAFSENLSAKPDTIILNGQPINAENILFVPGTDTVTISKAGIPTNIVLGTTYPLYISGAKDLVGNTMALFQDTITYNIVSMAPEVDGVKVLGEHSFELTFSEALGGVVTNGGDNSAVLGLSITKNNIPLAHTATTTDGKTFTIHLPTDPNVLFDGTKNETSAVLKVSVENYKDLANNMGEKYVDQVTVKKDTQGPSVTKAEYLFTDGEFSFTFNEGLASMANTGVLASGITLINNNTGVETTITEANIKPINSGDKRVIIRNTGDNGLGLAPGVYTFSFAKGLFKDQALNGGNATAAFKSEVSVQSTAVDTIKPMVAGITSTAKDQITVTFSEAVKGGAGISGSATDPANYRLNNVALPANTVIALNAGQSIATIKMPAGSFDKTQTEILTIRNVQDLAGNTIESVDRPVQLTDSTRPLLQSAVLDATSGAIVLSFNETIHGAQATTPVSGDFIVKVNNVVVADVVVAPGTTNKQVNITSQGTNFSTGNITITTASTTTGSDAAGNSLAPDKTVTLTR